MVRGSLEGVSVRSRSGPREAMPPRRFRGDPGDPPAAATGAADGGGPAAEPARRSIDASCCCAVGLDVSCSSCACASD